MGMAAPIYYTADMVRALPEDGNRYEVVYGELLVTAAPRMWHEIVQRRLMFALDAYLREHPIGEVLGSRGDISWGPDVLVSPDVFVVPLEQVRTME
jgi:Uma2 family endonuclease